MASIRQSMSLGMRPLLTEQSTVKSKLPVTCHEHTERMDALPSTPGSCVHSFGTKLDRLGFGITLLCDSARVYNVYSNRPTNGAFI